MNKPLLVLTTFPNIDTAQQVAKQIVQAKHAACVNIIPQIQSIYMWQGKECNESECLALIKTTEKTYLDLEALILSLHPYELPEIIATQITNGSKDYLTWLKTSTEA